MSYLVFKDIVISLLIFTHIYSMKKVEDWKIHIFPAIIGFVGAIIGSIVTRNATCNAVEKTYELNNKPVLYFESGSFLDYRFIDYYKFINPNLLEDECVIDLYSMGDFFYDENENNKIVNKKNRMKHKYEKNHYLYEDSIKPFEKIDLQEFYCSHNHKPYIIEFNMPYDRVQTYQVNGDLDLIQGLYHQDAIGVYSIANDGGKIALKVEVKYKLDDLVEIFESYNDNQLNVKTINGFKEIMIAYKGYTHRYSLNIDKTIDEKIGVVTNKHNYMIQLDNKIIEIIGILRVLNRLSNEKYDEIKIPITVEYRSIKSNKDGFDTENFYLIVSCKDSNNPVVKFYIEKDE